MHSNAYSALGGSSDVVPVPCNSHRHIGVDATLIKRRPIRVSDLLSNPRSIEMIQKYAPTDSQKGSDVLHGGLVGGDEHHETGNSDQAEGHHEDASLLCFIRRITPRNRGKAANDVGWHAHQLRLLVSVAHVLHNGGEEERDRVKRGVNA